MLVSIQLKFFQLNVFCRRHPRRQVVGCSQSPEQPGTKEAKLPDFELHLRPVQPEPGPLLRSSGARVE